MVSSAKNGVAVGGSTPGRHVWSWRPFFFREHTFERKNSGPREVKFFFSKNTTFERIKSGPREVKAVFEITIKNLVSEEW